MFVPKIVRDFELTMTEEQKALQEIANTLETNEEKEEWNKKWLAAGGLECMLEVIK